MNHTLPSIVLCLTLVLCLAACTEPRYRVPHHAEMPAVSIERFDREFFDSARISQADFWQLYVEDIMHVGRLDDPASLAMMEVFRTDADMQQVYSDAQKLFPTTDFLSRVLSKAFGRLVHFFPEMPVPAVSTHISGFGQSVVSAPGRLSVSLDKYLGADYPLYAELFYPYQWHRMSPDHMAADCLNGWIRSEFTNESIMNDFRLVDYLIYEGKLLFLLHLIMPDEPFEHLAGWNRPQLEWCRDNEKRMWERLLEYDHLFSDDPLVLSKYINDGPSTVYFTEDSPGRAAIWTGYSIVCQYMKRQPAISVAEMFLETDGDVFLQKALYRPE